MLLDIVKSCFEKAQERKKAEGFIILERGFATIPLPGIDVPFHSRYLWAGVMPFRACASDFNSFVLILAHRFYRPLKEDQRSAD